MKKSRSNLILILLACALPFLSYAQETRDIALEDAISRGLVSNRQLVEQRMKLQLAKNSFLIDIRRFFPQLSVTWSDSATINYLEADSISRQLGIKISQFLTDGGRTQSERKLTLISLQLQEGQLNDAEDGLKDQIWNLYMQIALSREKIRLQSTNLELSLKQLAVLDIQRSQGGITDLDHLEAVLKIKDLEIALATNKTTLRQQERDFLRILDLPRDTLFELEEPGFTSYQGLSMPAKDYLLGLAFKNNGNAEQIAIQILQAREQLRLTRRQYIPSIQLDANLTVSGSEFPLSQPQGSVSLVLDFSGAGNPVTYSNSLGSTSSGGRTQNSSVNVSPLSDISFPLNLRSQELSLRSLQDQYSETREQLDVAIQNALDQYELQLQNLELQRERIDLETSRYAILERKWELGEIQQLELLSASTSMSQHQIELLDSVMTVIQAEREIEKLVGLDPGRLSDISSPISDNIDGIKIPAAGELTNAE